MARQILPIAGQIIGGMIGGPVGAAIGGALGSAIGQYVDPIRHQGPKLGEARAQTAQEGVYRPLVFGTGCVAGNVIHRSPRKVVVHREDASGKGNRDTVDTERGYRTFAIRIAEAHTPEGYALLRIWENETLVYDVRPESEIPAESAEYAEKFRFYPGTHDQLPDPDLEAYLGVGNVNSYRGSCYIVFGNFDLTDYGDMVPQYRFEIASSYVAGNGPYFATSTDRTDGQILRTYNFDTWEAVDTGLGNYPTCIRCVNGKVVVGSFGEVAVSDDLGDSFRLVNLSPDPGATECRSISWGSASGYCVVFADSSSDVYYSSDSISFTGVSPLGAFARVKRGSETVGSTTVIGLNGAIGVTPNGGVSWVETFPPGGAQTIGSVCNFNGMFVAVQRQDGRTSYSSNPASGSWAVIEDPWGLPQTIGTYGIDASDTHVAMIAGDGSVLYTDSFPGGWTLVSPVAGNIESTQWQSTFRFLGRNWFCIDTGGIVGMGSTPGNMVAVGSAPGSGAFNGIAGFESVVVTGGKFPLSSIISFCHRRVGQPSSEFDVTELDDQLDGVVFADGYTARDAITTLLPIYNADASEHDKGSGYRINYIKRGAPVVRTLTIDDLVDEPEETVREDPMERPRVLHMAFESPVTGYTAGKASIQRLSPDVKLVNEVSTYVPVTFKDVDEAWQRADVQMRVAWTEVHGERTFSIADDQLDVVPTDVLALSLRGQVQRLRVLKVEYADGVMKMEAVADRQSNYTSHVTGIPLPAPEKPPPSLMGPAALAILDIPAISDQHDRLGYYVGVTGTADAFAGAVLQRQQNGQWSDVVTIGRSQRTTMGVLENTVTAGSQHYTDTTNTVSVSLYMDDELESLSNAQWLNKGGAFALETATGWEIMQYRDAYQDSGGVWHLTHLARGRLNTVADEHLPGARFVMLDRVQFIDATVGMIGQPLTLRAAAVGRSPETAVSETITYQGNSQREFPLAHLLSEGIDGGEITVQMVPRHRFGTEDHPVRSVNWEGYRLHASVVVAQQTVDTISDTQTFTVPGPASGIEITVGQLNRYTGQGPTTSETYLK